MSEGHFRIPHEEWGAGWKAGPVHTLLHEAVAVHEAEVDRRLKAALDAHFGSADWAPEDIKHRLWRRVTPSTVSYYADGRLLLRVEL